MGNNKIRPLYSQLKGYLSQAPSLKSSHIIDNNLWESYNKVIDDLNTATTSDKYESFRIHPTNHEGGNGYLAHVDIATSTYRTNLAGLISYLHGEYFSEEIEPFSGTPGTVITNSQSQQQTQTIQTTVLQLQEKIIKKLNDESIEKNEKDFLTKLKETLPTVTNIFQLFITIVKLAKEFGVNIDSLLKLMT